METQKNRILELFSKPFVLSEYFKTNERIFVGESLINLLKNYPFFQFNNYELGHLQTALILEGKMFDEEIIRILLKQENYPKSIVVDFLDIALHIERRLVKDYKLCEVVYISKPSILKALSIDTRDRDGRLELQIFDLNKSANENVSSWKEGTRFLRKVFKQF